ncbi:MAG: hypothetical protein UDQ92_08030 [Lachnospiraceae bacterium]|nr:hypothetical protein [Lachnospiraceae bacterium]
MFNGKLKKIAIQEAQQANEIYKLTYENALKKVTELYENKQNAVKILKAVEAYVETLSNKPYELQKRMSEIQCRRKAFENEVKKIEIESKKADKVSGRVAGAGMAAGAGVAAFGPTAAMAVATTFGTASTGTAIASLSGAAATKAALAWLGGGALTAGGGGMAAGQAFLAMAGPVGWSIGGAALIGGALLASSKNKKIAEKAEKQTKEIQSETDKMKRIKIKVIAEIEAISPLVVGISFLLKELNEKKNRDYNLFSMEEKNKLMSLMNSAEALSKRIEAKIV